MTTIDVQPSLYYTAASALHTHAVDLYNAFNNRADALNQCGSMAGSYDEARSWAAGYDANAHQAIDSMTALAEAMDAYAGALRTIGYNHQLGDWNATTGDKGPAPVKPADPLPAVLMCRKPAPSAGGPGNGLTDAIHLAEKVGITIPDGDLDKLASIAGTWTAMQTDHAIAGLAEGIGRISSSISLIKSPEVAQILDDLQAMKLSASTIASACGDVAQSCHSHHDDLHDLREKLKKQLEDLAKDLIEQEAITLAIGVAASFLTFGAGAVIAAARTAQLVEKFATPIREMVTVWIDARKAKKEYDATKTLAGMAKKDRETTARLQKAEAQAKKEAEDKAKADAKTRTASTGEPLTVEDEWILAQGPSTKKGEEMISALRENRVTPEMQQEIDRYNAALKKLPDYKGDVVRHTKIPKEVLDSYVPGQVKLEKGFTCASSNPNGTLGGVNIGDANAEFNIVSKTGKPVGKWMMPEEVQFKDHTNFLVHDKYFDNKVGRWIIDMEEL
ncbi:hypothetical protein [Nocardia vaccinii]|uniref:hypothetical protein n=1 Tax=Nocardia vaccinii TaxID=1822 RepID=UPI00082DC855|nr:hypothetical protein [Nocardia vaccinii]